MSTSSVANAVQSWPAKT